MTDALQALLRAHRHDDADWAVLPNESIEITYGLPEVTASRELVDQVCEDLGLQRDPARQAWVMPPSHPEHEDLCIVILHGP